MEKLQKIDRVRLTDSGWREADWERERQRESKIELNREEIESDSRMNWF